MTNTFTTLECEQRSPAWFQARLGRITGTGAHDMLTTIKSGESAARRNLRIRLILERLTQQSQENGFVSADMQHGLDTEAEAFAAYEAMTGVVLSRAGFFQHLTLMAGYSPDGYLGQYEGLVEIKCPKSATHFETLKTRVIPVEYAHQNLHGLWLTGAPWLDYFSYDNRFPPGLRMICVRQCASWADRRAHHQAIEIFLGEVDREMDIVAAMARNAQINEPTRRRGWARRGR